MPPEQPPQPLPLPFEAGPLPAGLAPQAVGGNPSASAWDLMSERERRAVVDKGPPKTSTWWIPGFPVTDPSCSSPEWVKVLAETSFGKVSQVLDAEAAGVRYGRLVLFAEASTAEASLEVAHCQDPGLGLWQIMPVTHSVYWKSTQPALWARVKADERAAVEAAAKRAAEFSDPEVRRRLSAKALDGPVAGKTGILFKVHGFADDAAVDAFVADLAKDLQLTAWPGWRRQMKSSDYFFIFSDWSGVVSRLLGLGRTWLSGHAVEIVALEPGGGKKKLRRDAGRAAEDAEERK